MAFGPGRVNVSAYMAARPWLTIPVVSIDPRALVEPGVAINGAPVIHAGVGFDVTARFATVKAQKAGQEK